MTFQRLVQSSIEDIAYAHRIALVRSYYLRVFAGARAVPRGPPEGRATRGVSRSAPGAWQLTLKAAGMIAVVNSIVMAVCAGLVVLAAGVHSLAIPVAAGAVHRSRSLLVCTNATTVARATAYSPAGRRSGRDPRSPSATGRRGLKDECPTRASMTPRTRTLGPLTPVDAVDHVRGDPIGPVIVEYGDYECPYARVAFREIQRVQSRTVNAVRFVFRHFPLTEVHPHALRAAAAAEAAALQDQFWPMHALLFHRQNALSDDYLRRYAAKLGLDVVRFDHDRAGPAVLERVRRDVRERQGDRTGDGHTDPLHRWSRAPWQL